MKALRMPADEFLAMQAKINSKLGKPVELDLTKRAPKEKTRQKYGNVKVETQEGTFDSKAEYRYYCTLLAREHCGQVRNIRRQVPYELAPGVSIKGRMRPPVRYLADFVFDELQDNGSWVNNIVADVKGKETDVYILKRHLLKSVHGIDILEIKS